MSEDYISDSDQENSSSIDSAMISTELLEVNILRLSPSKRQQTRLRLFRSLTNLYNDFNDNLMINDNDNDEVAYVNNQNLTSGIIIDNQEIDQDRVMNYHNIEREVKHNINQEVEHDLENNQGVDQESNYNDNVKASQIDQDGLLDNFEIEQEVEQSIDHEPATNNKVSELELENNQGNDQESNNQDKLEQVVLELDNQDIIEDSEDSETDTLSLVQRNLSTISNDNAPEDKSQTQVQTDEAVARQYQEKENELHLQNYLDLRSSNTTSRRSLRKRNFASTHPYLADQAHYLGLSNLNYLNEIYEENNQDLEPIVKYLNYNYLKLKKSYPRDDKYKSKNFYAILGRQSQLAKQKELEESNEKDFEPPSENLNDLLSSQIYSDLDTDDIFNLPRNSLIEEDEFHNNRIQPIIEEDSSDECILPSKRHHPVIRDDQSDDEMSNSSSEADEAYVRVGGRYRKERSALRGVLPESAKRLDIYKKPKMVNHQKQAEIEYKRGVAVRKAKKRTINREDFNGFVDDEITYDTANELYHELYEEPIEEIQAYTHSPSPPPTEPDSRYDMEPISRCETKPMSRYETILISDRSSSEDEESEYEDDLNIFEMDKEVPPTEQNDMGDMNEIQNFEVRESDHINHMFASNNKSSSGKKRKRGTSKPRSVGYGKSNRQYKSTLNKYSKSAYPKSSTSSESRSSRHPSKKRTYKSSTSGDVYIKLPFKTVRKRQKSNTSFSAPRIKHSSVLIDHGDPQANEKPKKKNKKGWKNSKIDTYLNFRGDKNDYLFSRTPILSTTVFEAEVDPGYLDTTRTSNPSAPQVLKLDSQPLFNQDCMLNDINLKRIKEMIQGKTYIRNKHSVTINFMSENYVLSLIETSAARLTSERLLNKIYRSIKNCMGYNEELINGVYNCIHQLIIWYLMIQQPPSLMEIKLIQVITTSTINSSLPSSSVLFLLPYLQLFQLTMSKIADLNSQVIKVDNAELSIAYWTLFFDSYTYETFNLINFETNKSKAAESFFIAYSLIESRWISKALTKYDPINISILLDCILNLCLMGKVHSWEVIQLVYSKINDYTDPEFHYKYIEIIYLLNQRKHWPLDEKVLLQIYSSITARKFANFQDEIGVPDLISQVRSKSDLPSDTFFDRFMQLLYWYCSGIEASKIKRLVIKLFTTSEFQYEKDQDHMIMFINRLNFMTLLSSLSTVDLKSQLLPLINIIEKVYDIKLTSVILEFSMTLVNISIEKNLKLPMDALSILLTCFNNKLFTTPGILRLWKKYSNYLTNTINNTPLYIQIQFLQLNDCINPDIPDKILGPLLKLFCKICDVIITSKAYVDLKVIKKVQDTNSKILHLQMGRIPLPSITEEGKIAELIETSISLWIKCAKILNENWDRLILQTFPYTGNRQSREQFALFFYHEISQFYDLLSCKEMLNRTIIKELTNFHPTSVQNLWKLISRLKNWKTLNLNKKELTLQTFQNSRVSILQRIISNISSYCKPEEITLYIKNILKNLTSEFNNYFSSTWYKEFCSEILKEIQKKVKTDYIDQDSLFSLSLKLGISKSELDQLKFHTRSLKERLEMFHAEFFNSVYYAGDHNEVLKKYTFKEGTELIYQTIYIYMNEVANDETKWEPIHILLKFFTENIEFGKFNIDEKFKGFLKAINQILYIHNDSSIYYYFEAQRMVLKLFKYGYFLFDGYRDQEVVTNCKLDVVDLPYNIHTEFTLASINKSNSEYPKQVQVDNNSRDKYIKEKNEFIQFLSRPITGDCLYYDL
ncbi:unnamed protein product [Candida verbasci]|uniref:Uncharacterized protein n=1 Tax=Candida verbasci TaxID=1227364 RepID=A0A9W4TRP0_9ASCO|nr:unnamed protein product [Candida verbasci]